MNLFRKKPVQGQIHDSGMKRSLGATELTMLGVGSVIGAGIFVLTGISAATQAGPAVVLSFILAGFACGCAALSYAEMASSVGGCGSAYGYGHAALGELPAWVIGWMLLCEYTVAIPAVATGWSGYADTVLRAIGIELPRHLMAGPFDPVSPGLINLPASAIILVTGALLLTGAKLSSHFNTVMVVVKVSAILLFLGIASGHIDLSNWTPFIPPRETLEDGSHRFGISGVVTGAATIFFAYLGFDAVATAAEETRNPQRDVPIGLITSLAICTLLYISVAAVLTGVVPYRELNVSSPVAEALLRLGKHWAAGLVSIGALTGLTTAILASYFGLTRILLAMSRDRLIPAMFGNLSPRTRVPQGATIIAGVVMALAAGLVPLGRLAEVANIGTLGCFVAVCVAVLIMRHTHPDMPRPFRAPFSPVIPALGVLSCGYLMLMLGRHTWIVFGIWMAIGLLLYASYGYRNSRKPTPRPFVGETA